jgi:hypothetical protein
LLESAGVTIFLSLLSALLLFSLSADEPSPELLETLGQIGATLLIAYVLEVSWLVKASRKRPLEERENRLGAFLGIGAAGLISIAIALLLAGRADHGDWKWWDELGLGFVVGPLLMAGIVVALQPLLTHEWLDDEDPPVSASDS